MNGLVLVRSSGCASILAGPDDPVGPRALDPLGLDEALVDIPLAVRDRDDPGAGDGRRHGTRTAIAQQPAVALFLLRSVCSCVGRSSGSPRGSRPQVIASMTPSGSRSGVTASWTCWKKPVALLPVQRPGPFDRLPGPGEIQFGGVLGQQDDGMLGDAGQGGLAMRAEDLLGGDPGMGEEAIGTVASRPSRGRHRGCWRRAWQRSGRGSSSGVG